MVSSILLVLITGYLLGILFKKLGLPELLGMIVAGVIIGASGFNLLSHDFLSYKKEIMGLALIVVLIKAGFSIQKSVLIKVGAPAIKLGILPSLAEGFSVTLIAMLIFKLDFVIAGTLGFIIAAVSPAVVIPSMVKFQEQGYGTKEGIPTMILASASLDDIVALTMFSFFFNAASTATELSYLSILSSLSFFVLAIIIGIVLGFLIPFVFRAKKQWFIAIEVLVLVVVFALFKFSDYANGTELLTFIIIAFILKERLSYKIEEYKFFISKAWNVMQIFLFVLIGAIVDVKLAFSIGLVALVIVLAGLVVRVLVSYLCVANTSFTSGEKLFVGMANIPKATVQASIGALPLTYGLTFGSEILSISVLSIVVTAPLGLVLLNTFVSKLLSKEEVA